MANQKRSLNTAGQFRGGGVCIDCLQKTMGINCETCVDGYYRPHRVRAPQLSPSFAVEKTFRPPRISLCIEDISFCNISSVFLQYAGSVLQISVSCSIHPVFLLRVGCSPLLLNLNCGSTGYVISEFCDSKCPCGESANN